MKIISWNVNGIRSRIFNDNTSNQIGKVKTIYPENDSPIKKILEYDPDIICLQETRCDMIQGNRFKIQGYTSYFNCSTLEGARSPNRYSGTAVFIKSTIPVKNVEYQIDNYNDTEGRIIIINTDEYKLFTVYAPNSGTNYENKINFMNAALNYLNNTDLPTIFCGDMNIAVDTHFDKSKVEEGPGFYKHELQFYNDLHTINYKDCLSFEDDIIYTWWDPRQVKIDGISRARKNNKGWRLDYFFTKGIDNLHSKVHKNIGETNPLASDHAPIFLI